MGELQVQFEVSGMKLYGMLHLPDDGYKCPCVIFCHGFTGHRIEAHRLFVKAAREMAHFGIGAFRFDFRGSGESEGDFGDITITGELEDLRAAIHFVSSVDGVDANRIALLGLSLGGCVAACCAPTDERIRALVLWAAVARPSEILRRHLGTNAVSELEEKGWIDIGGLKVSRAFFDELPDVKPVEFVRRFKGRALIVHGSADLVVPVEDAKLYAEALGSRSELHIIEGADHTFARCHHEEQVIRLTRNWLLRQLCTAQAD
ncbi:MAG: alpha/beta fold hydrolase [Armatimonadota bacterium]|nr:alpha/beta fold hydrolase [Armatimonadota bacterium]MCX7777309.1 alpha/beta fold hydrolase [Armatimonadota bacterium]MDW8024374.1 alpha/beta fold hydrolase [Armatimonadota bacterium]